MKKLFIPLFLLLSTSTFFANAQSSVNAGVVVMPQITALLNLQDFAAGKELDYTLTTGFAGGLSGAYNFNNHIGIELDLLISGQGEKYKGDLSFYKGSGADTASYARIVSVQSLLENNTDSNYTDKISLTYFKIPVLFKLTSNTEKHAWFFLSVGPEFNFLVGASESFDGNTVSYTSNSPLTGSFSFQTKQLFTSTNVDAVLNIGAGFKLTDNLSLTAQINFDYGLGDAENKSFEFPISIFGFTQEEHAYASNRSSNPNGSAGLKLGLTYKFGGSSK